MSNKYLCRKASYIRRREGITHCKVCSLCDKIFPQLGGGSYRYCPECGEDSRALARALYFTRRGALALGHYDAKELKKVRNEMAEEEGEEFTVWLLGPVCGYLKKQKEMNEQ